MHGSCLPWKRALVSQSVEYNPTNCKCKSSSCLIWNKNSKHAWTINKTKVFILSLKLFLTFIKPEASGNMPPWGEPFISDWRWECKYTSWLALWWGQPQWLTALISVFLWPWATSRGTGLRAHSVQTLIIIHNITFVVFLSEMCRLSEKKKKKLRDIHQRNWPTCSVSDTILSSCFEYQVELSIADASWIPKLPSSSSLIKDKEWGSVPEWGRPKRHGD